MNTKTRSQKRRSTLETTRRLADLKAKKPMGIIDDLVDFQYSDTFGFSEDCIDYASTITGIMIDPDFALCDTRGATLKDDIFECIADSYDYLLSLYCSNSKVAENGATNVQRAMARTNAKRLAGRLADMRAIEDRIDAIDNVTLWSDYSRYAETRIQWDELADMMEGN